ncbi:MAG: lysylphosphatidylglycerol synthase transmembrane domain-containing protein [Anaerolineaceae bacterium]|nr:lysylphosphatidylglycerol synthase transmembrane domain-containing protein [Anaerolineaceae bacterium]
MKNSKNIRRWVQIIGSLLSSGLFLWLILKQNWALTWHNLQHLPVWLWPVCLALVLSGMVFNGLRWYVLLRAQKVALPLLEALKITFAGAFSSNFLPSTIGGDAVRMVSLYRFTTNKTLIVASVVIDRAMNVLAMASVIPFAIITFGNPFDFLKDGLTPHASIALSPLASKIVSFLIRIKNRLIQTFSIWLHQPMTLLAAYLISWLSVLVIFLEIWLLAHFLGIPVALYQVLGVTITTYVVSVLPISVNGYGLREVAMTTLYMHLGASLEQASTLALVSRFFMVLQSLPGALFLAQVLPVKINSEEYKKLEKEPEPLDGI